MISALESSRRCNEPDQVPERSGPSPTRSREGLKEIRTAFDTHARRRGKARNEVVAIATGRRGLRDTNSMIPRSKSSRGALRVRATLARLSAPAMGLLPRRPPGHGNRKALAFASDILRLRGEGHSLEAIREALEDAGVVVSISTVHREVARGSTPPAHATPPAAPVIRRLDPSSTASRGRATAPSSAGSVSVPLPGRGMAEEFMRGRITNPLLRKEIAK
jgi:hypothetical protein